MGTETGNPVPLPEGESGEVVALHCDATSFDAATADLRAVAAIRIRGNRILTSQAFTAEFWPTEPPEPALGRLLQVIGRRPLVGFYLDFAVDILNRYVQPMIGQPLPNERIEVSRLYYAARNKSAGKFALDLRFDSIIRSLDLPLRAGDDARSNAVASAMVYLRLSQAENG